MNRPRPIDPLTEALRSLPREKASDQFTARILSRLETPQRRFPALPGRLLAAAATLAVIVAVPWLDDLRDRRRIAEIRQSAANLRRESTVLEHQMEQMRERYDRQSVIYLGGDDSVDLVLDMRPLTRRPGNRDIRPAGRRSNSQP